MAGLAFCVYGQDVEYAMERRVVSEALEFNADRVAAAVNEGIGKVTNASDLDELYAFRAQYTGGASELARASRAIGGLSPDQKKDAGKLIGSLRADFGRAYGARENQLKQEEEEKKLAAETVDMTQPVRRHPIGARHPLPKLLEDVEDFFVSMGWQIAEGPEVETEWHDFDALNFGPDHPARQMQDTFYIKGNQAKDSAGFTGSNMVMRTHTSPVQARSLLERGVPLYIACPGRVYRTDELDDKLAVAMFGPEALTRLRPSYFPFTEPSAEMDLWFPDKKGGAGWIEWGGCGMVNPRVLMSAGIDPSAYSGFAFGVGMERTLLLRHDIDDMHDLVEGDQRFSQQFVMGE